jgi:hypothetical protein
MSGDLVFSEGHADGDVSRWSVWVVFFMRPNMAAPLAAVIVHMSVVAGGFQQLPLQLATRTLSMRHGIALSARGQKKFTGEPQV